MACKIIPRPVDALPLPSQVSLIGPTSSIKDIPFIMNTSIKKEKTNAHQQTSAQRKEKVDDQRILREAGISLLLHHPNIVSMQEFIVDTHYYYMFFEVS